MEDVRLVLTLILAPFILVLGIVLLFLLRTVLKTRSSRRWARADGRIISSAVVTYLSTDDDGGSNRMFKPDVVYEYAAHGRMCRSRQISLDGIDGSTAQSWAHDIVRAYPPGDSVLVFYNPDKPEEAILEVSSGWSMSAGIAFVVILIELVLLALLISTWLSG